MEKMREEMKLQGWVDRIQDGTYVLSVHLSDFLWACVHSFRFKAGLCQDKTYPRMLLGEEPYVEPTKLERLSLRESHQQQWITPKVRLICLSTKHHLCFEGLSITASQSTGVR